MEHTYLLEEGKWNATGFYSDDNTGIVKVQAYTTTTHSDDIWINDGSMKLLIDPPIEFFNRYEIVPLAKNADMTSWQSFNPALGMLKGSFMIVEDSILSKYSSKDGIYSGFEYLKKIDDNTYENRGFAFVNDAKLSSWAVVLKRIE